MRLNIEGIRDQGKLEDERIVFEANEDCDIGIHAIFAARTNDKGEIFDYPVYECFWFPDQGVKKGDLVIVYTKAGKHSSKTNSTGNSSYFYYWNQQAPIWKKGRGVVLIEIKRWSKALIRSEDVTEESAKAK